jgi:hypothetical protein
LGELNRNSARIPRRLRRGKRAHIQIRLKVLTVEDFLQLASGFFNSHDFQDEELFVTEAVSLLLHRWATKQCINGSTLPNSRKRKEEPL